MVENVALTKKKQKSFNKSVEKTKDKIKKGDIKIAEKPPKRQKKSLNGVIYVSNIPHGFYEKEMKGYFTQFGAVLKVRVARSKRTGNSKGFGFVQFKDMEVAKIAAETMNNYLMGKRLIKAKFLPFDNKTKERFKRPNFSKEHYPTMVRRIRFKKYFNAAVSSEKQQDKTTQVLKHIKNVTNKLKEVGIDYDFTPVQIPKSLLESKKKENIADDSSSEDIVFTSPEEMKKKLKEPAIKKLKKNNKRKGTDNADIGSPKKAKKIKNKIENSEIGKPLKKQKNNNENENNNKEQMEVKKGKKQNIKKATPIKDNKNTPTKENKNTPTKEKKQKIQIQTNLETKENRTNEKIENTSTKDKKNKKKLKINKITINETNKIIPTKQKNKKNILERNHNVTNEDIKNLPAKNMKGKKNHKQIETTENSTNENNENINKEEREKKQGKKNKQTENSENIVNNVLETDQIKKKNKKPKDNEVEISNEQKGVKTKIIGVTKKLKKTQKPVKISNKKADLIKEQIKESAQVKTIKKIEKRNSPGKKKNKTSL